MDTVVLASDDWAYIASSHVLQYYPNVTTIYFCREDGSSEMVPPRTSVRERSRGKHHAGSGNYACSHAYAPGDLSGWVYGSVLWLTSCPLVSAVVGSNTYTVKFSYGTYEYSRYYPRANRTQYWFQLYMFEGDGYWHRTEWYADVRYRTDEATIRSIAMASEPQRTSHAIRWNRRRHVTDGAKTTPATIEHRFLSDCVETGTFINLGTYLNAAYVSAYESLPAITTNNIANIIQIYDGLKSIIRLRSLARNGRRVIDSVGSLSDAWLGYRYSYSTTKSDIEELVGYADRMRAVMHASALTGHGKFETSLGDDVFTFRCSLQVPTTNLGDIYSDAEKFGLALDGYNAWDLIPYSFIVDWFLHIGDTLERARSRNYAVRLHPSAVWYSITHEFTNSYGCHQCDYYRWRGTPGMYDSSQPASILEHGSAKQSTWVKRAADAVALLS